MSHMPMISTSMGKQIFGWKAVEREGEIFLGYFRSRAHIQHLRLVLKKLKRMVRSVARGLILMRQEAERGIEVCG